MVNTVILDLIATGTKMAIKTYNLLSVKLSKSWVTERPQSYSITVYVTHFGVWICWSQLQQLLTCLNDSA